MSDHEDTTPDELTGEELEAQDGEHLPPREVMSLVDLDGGAHIAEPPDGFGLDKPLPQPESETETPDIYTV